MSDASPPRPNPRLHHGGKIASRHRVKTAPAAGLPVVVGGEDPPPLPALLPPGIEAVEIEVGSGKGMFVLAATAAKPHTFVLGIEAALPYAQFAAERLQRSGRKNGLFLVDNAKAYLEDRVPAASLTRLHVYYPDPWPKRRHRRRRFFTAEIPATIARVLRDDGHLLVATDNPAYAGQICAVLGASDLLERDFAEEVRLLASPPGIGFSPTHFERKYREEGRILRRYAYRKRR